MSDDDSAAQGSPPPPPPRGPGGKPLADAAGGIEKAGTTGPAMGSGLATGAGLARDAADLGSSAARGDLGGAAEATTRAGVTAAAAYFGGTAGGDAARKALNTGIGKALTGTSRWIVWGAIAAILLPLFLGTAVIAGMFSAFGGAAAMAACAPGAATGGSTPLENPTPEQVAGQIYAQVKGYGYGDYAAGIALASAYFETTMTNLAEGDQWKSGRGMTPSRGVYQQFSGAVPPELAWSGQPDPGNYNPENQADYSRYNESNAWGPGGWAVQDPRMNVAQAANIFVLGMGSGSPDTGTGYWGLDSPYMPSKEKLTSDATPSQQEVWSGMYYVQGFNPASGDNQAWAQQGYAAGIQWLKDIQAGKVPVPPFVPPMDFMKARADSALTKAVVAGTSPTSPSSPAAPSAPANQDPDGDRTPASPGLLLVGDSLAEGVAVESGVFPKVYDGGPTSTRTQVGITSAEALAAWSKDIREAPARILVSLGANNYADSNATFGGQVDRFVALAGSDRQVYWYTQHYSKSEHFNSVLVEKAAKYPNLHLVDVATLLRPGSGYTSSADGYLHPNAAGYAAMWKAAEAAMGGAVITSMGSADCVPGVDGVPIDVNPGSTPLPRPDEVPPAYGFSVNLPGGRNMTYYSQADPRWNPPNTAYDFASCGCGTTSAAMIIATLAGKPDYTPLHAAPEQDRLGGIVGGYPNGCGSYHDPTAQLFAQHGLQYKRIASASPAAWAEVEATLKAGGLVLMSVRGPTAFFNGAGHFVVVRGVAADGKYLIADPNGLVTGPTVSTSAGYTADQITVNTGFTLVLPPGQTFQA